MENSELETLKTKYLAVKQELEEALEEIEKLIKTNHNLIGDIPSKDKEIYDLNAELNKTNAQLNGAHMLYKKIGKELMDSSVEQIATMSKQLADANKKISAAFEVVYGHQGDYVFRLEERKTKNIDGETLYWAAQFSKVNSKCDHYDDGNGYGKTPEEAIYAAAKDAKERR